MSTRFRDGAAEAWAPRGAHGSTWLRHSRHPDPQAAMRSKHSSPRHAWDATRMSRSDGHISAVIVMTHKRGAQREQATRPKPHSTDGRPGEALS